MPFALTPRIERLILFGVAVCWLLAVGAGLAKVWAYANTPGQAADAPSSWPGTSRLVRAADKPTLVMLVHPHCPCSRASIGELAVLMARVRGLVTAHVLIYRPPDAGPEWAQSDLRATAAAIPGVVVATDIDGDEAARFGGYVSGQTMLFSPDGRLEFSGGITFARGHSGDSAGRDALQSLIRRQPTPIRRAPVFGCALGRPAST